MVGHLNTVLAFLNIAIVIVHYTYQYITLLLTMYTIHMPSLVAIPMYTMTSTKKNFFNLYIYIVANNGCTL